MTYGNGLMHVGDGGRAYLHHTGGMVSFSSSFHVDVASGVGAFASSTISAFAEYRPRLLTRFAVDALTNALARPAAARAAGARRPRCPMPAAYVGTLSRARAATFEVRAGSPLTIVADGESRSAPAVGRRDLPHHPSGVPRVQPDVRAQRPAGSPARAGARTAIPRAGAAGHLPPSNPELAQARRALRQRQSLARHRARRRARRQAVARHRSADAADRRESLAHRRGELVARARQSFADFIDGRPQTFVFSGDKFLRHDI